VSSTVIEHVLTVLYLDGMTTITVTGTNFYNTPEIRCRWCLWTVFATYISTSRMACISPLQPVGPCPVEITNNNQGASRRCVGLGCPDGR
jgi:hypothetical protein